ncbi:hypothetical protein GQ42DRAFT_24499 [Ramicandelaber brevisporus]|nr:hypothetical protein GQ42DRAFT_24499 [Ramicandelaber brevisporus]
MIARSRCAVVKATNSRLAAVRPVYASRVQISHLQTATRLYSTETKATKPAEAATASTKSGKPEQKQQQQQQQQQQKPEETAAAAPKKGKFFRRLGIYSTLAAGLYAGGIYYSLENEDFGDIFASWVPGADVTIASIQLHEGNPMLIAHDLGSRFVHFTANAAEKTVHEARILYDKYFPAEKPIAIPPKPVAQPPSPATPKPQQPAAPKAVPTPAPAAPAASAPAPKATPAETLKLNPLDTIRLNVELPTNQVADPKLAALSESISTLVKMINSHKVDSETLQAVKEVSERLRELDTLMHKISAADVATLHQALEAQTAKYKQTLTELETASLDALRKRETELINDGRVREQHLTAAHATELSEKLRDQYALLHRQFERFIPIAVDQERNGRLAGIAKLSAQADSLAETAQRTGRLLGESAAIIQTSTVISALKDALHGTKGRRSVQAEIDVLSRSATSNPVVDTAISEIVSSSNPGANGAGAESLPTVATFGELAERFDGVRQRVHNAQFVPEDGGAVAHALSSLFSCLMFSKEGYVPGTDVEAILSRAAYMMKRHDLDGAARELNQLRGWPKQLASGWLNETRRHLATLQAIELIEAEFAAQALSYTN